MSEVISKNAPKPVGLYPHARRVGNLVFVSGMGPRHPTTNEIPAQFADQCHSVFQNVDRVLREINLSLDDVVDITVFLTDIKKDFATYNEIYAQYLKKAFPTRTTVEVSRLPTEISIEIKCIAQDRRQQ